MMEPRIPFNRPWLTGREPSLLEELAASGHLSGDGAFTKACQGLLEAELGVPKVLLTTSGTHALEMAALLADIGPGDEVVVPAFTFVSTVNAFVLRGATPVFVDIRPDTMNLDESRLPDAMTDRTRVVVPVHYAGVGCVMDKIVEIAHSHGAIVVEDNALSLFGRYRGKSLGTFGSVAAQSFHETKSFSCGEGGAVVINDARMIERAEILREKGTDRSQFFRGQVDKYTWRDIGSSYLPSDILAAFLLAQLEDREEICVARAKLWWRYYGELTSWAGERDVQLPYVPADCDPVHAQFHLVMSTASARNALIEHLRARGILAVFHYLPLHLSPMGQRFGGAPGQFPVTESVSERLIRLPFYNALTETDQAAVIDAIRQF